MRKRDVPRSSPLMRTRQSALAAGMSSVPLRIGHSRQVARHRPTAPDFALQARDAARRGARSAPYTRPCRRLDCSLRDDGGRTAGRGVPRVSPESRPVPWRCPMSEHERAPVRLPGAGPLDELARRVRSLVEA
ncbi:MAG: hypothetical protein ACK559_28055, partial [bacterium]